MWDKKVHVKSSMERKDSQWSLFIGRWQPLHTGHKELFRQVISEGGKVCVAIRDGENLVKKRKILIIDYKHYYLP